MIEKCFYGKWHNFQCYFWFSVVLCMSMVGHCKRNCCTIFMILSLPHCNPALVSVGSKVWLGSECKQVWCLEFVTFRREWDFACLSCMLSIYARSSIVSMGVLCAAPHTVTLFVSLTAVSFTGTSIRQMTHGDWLWMKYLLNIYNKEMAWLKDFCPDDVLVSISNEVQSRKSLHSINSVKKGNADSHPTLRLLVSFSHLHARQDCRQSKHWNIT